MSSVVSGLETIWQTLTNLPSLIAESIKGFFTDVKDAIVALPKSILDGIKAIFIPDMEEMKVVFLNFKEQLRPAGYAEEDINSLGGLLGIQEQKPTFNPTDYQMGGILLKDVTWLNTDWLELGIAFFRPIVNGFLIWLLTMFFYREILSFLGQAPTMGHEAQRAEKHLEKQGKEDD